MPNHITNIVKVEGSPEKVKELFLYVKGEKSEFDFNKIIPMPESLNITSGSNVDNAIAILSNDLEKFNEMLDWGWVKEEGIETVEELQKVLMKKLSPKDMQEGKIALDNLVKYGHKSWYSWSIANWGTKWNAYDIVKNNDNEIIFDTAWSTPFPVIEKLAQKFPELTIEVKFADEDIGSNCGVYSFEGGIFFSEYLPNGWSAMKFAIEIKGGDDGLALMVAQYLPYINEEKLDDDFIEDLNSFISNEELTEWFIEIVKNNCEDNEGIQKVKRIMSKVALENELYEIMDKIDCMDK